MKVVLFCGGRGVRIRDDIRTVESDADVTVHFRRAADAPKPMQTVGGRPILWHLMRWYATYGHADFVLCVGYRGHVIRDWVPTLAERAHVRASGHDGADSWELSGGVGDGWRVAVVDSGLDANVGERLAAVREHVAGEPMFLANYADGLSDVDLGAMVDAAVTGGDVATMLVAKPPSSLHTVDVDDGTGQVLSIGRLADGHLWVNAGFFILRPEVFDVLGPGEDLIDEPFQRLASAKSLRAVPHTGFWAAMDTAKDRMVLDELWYSGLRPWAVWTDDEASCIR